MNFKLKILKDLYDIEDYSQIHSFDFFADRLLIYSPLYLPDIEKAVAYLLESINKQESIFIISDKDVDGITSTVILYDYLRKRFPKQTIQYKNSTEGDYYGISDKILEEIKQKNPDLLIFLDMGSSHIHLLQDFISHKKKIIILDHHIPQVDSIQPEILQSIAFVNPLLSKIPLKHNHKIPTVGLVFKLILALEFSAFKILEKKQFVKYHQEYYLFQNGKFLKKTHDKKLLVSDEYKEIKIKTLHKDFPETSINSLGILLENSPTDFGKYITCLSIEYRKKILDIIMQYSTLVSIGYLADYVPLIDENRTIVRAGLNVLKYPIAIPKGLSALLQELGLHPQYLTSRDISWSIAPILNAAGRMNETEKAINLLLEENEMLALEKAKQLINMNHLRKEKTKKNQNILLENLNLINPSEPIIFFYHKELESGVSGIMASRLAETFQKPAIWINPEGKLAKGSIRSWNNINVLDLLMPLKDLFVDLGGHAEAAGFTIEYQNIEKLHFELKKINVLKKDNLSSSFNTSQNFFEISIQPRRLNEKLIQELRLLEPFGNGNKEIYFLLKSVEIYDVETFNDKHLKFKVYKTLVDIEFILWNVMPPLLNNIEVLQKSQWDISGVFERNFFSSISNRGCKYRFYVKSMQQKK